MTGVLAAANLTVDHVTVAGADLAGMRDRLRSAGISTEYGGPHANHATQMAVASFPDGSYLELIAPQSAPDAGAFAAHYWSKQMRENAGPAAWAVRSGDLPAEIDRLRKAGIQVSAPVRSGRRRPDGVNLEWETAEPGTEPNGTFFPFLIHDFTRREDRAFPSGQPSSADFTGIKHVVIAVRDLKAASARFRQAYGLPPPVEQEDADFGAHLAAFPDTPVILAAAIGEHSWIAQRIARFGEGPCAFLLGSNQRGPGSKTVTPGSKTVMPGSKTLWFGRTVTWFDAQKLGWHLGVE